MQQVQAEELGEALPPMAWWHLSGMAICPAAIEQRPREQQHEHPSDCKAGPRPPGTRAASSATSVRPAPIDRRITLAYHISRTGRRFEERGQLLSAATPNNCSFSLKNPLRAKLAPHTWP